MHNLAELGWLYRRIQSRIHIKLNDSSAGMIELALCHCLQEELREYDSLIASFETRRGGPTSSTSSTTKNDVSLSLDLADPGLGITLHRIAVWVEGYRLKMRMMGVLVESCTSERALDRLGNNSDALCSNTRRSPLVLPARLYHTRRPLHFLLY
jgi:gamma-tubulin complex component 3